MLLCGKYTMIVTYTNAKEIDVRICALPCKFIFACQGFCVFEALVHCGMFMWILTARRPVYNESFHCCND